MQTCSGTGRRLARVECGVVSIGCVRSAGLPCPLQRARPHGCRRRLSHVPKAAALEVHASWQLWLAYETTLLSRHLVTVCCACTPVPALPSKSVYLASKVGNGCTGFR